MLNRPTVDRFRQVLGYDPSTGELSWKAYDSCSPQWRGQYAGKRAFTHIGKDGYRVGAVDHHTLTAHRAIWIIVYGSEPEGQIDHINGDRLDNRLRNLRAVTQAENARNQKLHASNSSGFPGVYWNDQARRWLAQIGFNGKRMHIGLFDVAAEAYEAYRQKARELGFHENHGRRFSAKSTIHGDG